MSRIRVEVWADLVCPFCWIGHARLEEAIERLGVRENVEIVPRAFELDPTLSTSSPLLPHLVRKFGSAEAARATMGRVDSMGAESGLAFDWPRAIAAPTFDAHRLVASAEDGAPQLALRLMRAHFQEGADLGDAATLARLAAEAGTHDEAAARELLASSRLAERVREEELQARGMGIGGVPFFVFDGRFAVGGAQPVEVFERALSLALKPS